jgi:hypothetical protein
VLCALDGYAICTRRVALKLRDKGADFGSVLLVLYRVM